MTRLLLLISLIFVSLFPSYLYAQKIELAEIKGTIINKENQPISNVSLVLQTINKKVVRFALSDSTGHFSLDSLPYQKYLIEISMVGYQTYHSDTILFESKTNLNIQLEDSVSNLGEVKVATKKKLFEMLPDKMVMNVENNILAAGNSVYDIIRKAPMVSLDKEQNLLLKAQTPLIYVDDRPTYMSGTQLTEYLKSLPSESIATIEFITNPSSKYDAAGSAGIINIRLKKNKLYGFNGIVNARIGTGRYIKSGGGLNLNYRNGWLNTYMTWNTSYSQSYNALTYNSKIMNNEIASYQDRENYWHPTSTYNNFKGGADFNLNKKDVLSLVVMGYIENTKQITTNTSILCDAKKDPYQYIETKLTGKNKVHNITYNVNYKTNLDSLGSSIVIDADYAKYLQKDSDNNINNFTDPNGVIIRDPYIFKNNRPANIDIKSGKIDYTKYWASKYKLESGLKYSSVNTDNNLVVDSIRNNAWEMDYGRSNHFVYKEDIAAFYSTVSQSYGDLSLQLGLRGEWTRSNANSITIDKVVKRNYFNLFPTLFTTYKINDKNDLNFSYSRRINRPSYESLNPFVRYIDPYTSFVGNPFLKPSFSNSFELRHGFKQFLYTTLSYSHSANIITNTILQDSTTGKVVNSSDNASSRDYLYLNIYASIPIAKWWNSETSLNINYNRSKSSIPDYSYNTHGFGTDINTDHTFSLPKNIKIQTSFRYSFPSVDGLARMKTSYGWDLGVQKQILDKKGTIKIAATNIFAQAAYRAHYIGSGLDINWINRWEARRINVSFVYKFGNQKVKAANSRRTSSSEEQNRVNM
ncbi:outer membrane beta-barrel family protein [Rhizosphaericola mali]|uniref:TonB-dependent receptor n=1 Tax=Rhizosphaericola mali TaxID=2545455 RepID=A0A5P2G0Z4_9BACT|nr:outer membrane beta-barrel family protein [Rhizosphaericola mali]QES87779.1 TonB-dependent receptor [Rhizosphaericola mali]